MRVRILVTSVFASSTLGLALGFAQTTGPTPAAPAQVRAFADGLDTCAAGKVATQHPLMTTFVVEHPVAGVKDGMCMYTQTMPAKMTMACAFSAAGRRAMAADIRATVGGGPMGGGTNRAMPAWAQECEIVTAAGARSPMAPPAR